MASMLRLITSNLVTRSVVVPTFTSSASHFLSIETNRRAYTFLSIETNRRAYTTSTPTDDYNDESWFRVLCPKSSSLSFEMDTDINSTSLSVEFPNLNVNLDMPALLDEGEEISTFFVKGKTNKEAYLAGIKSLDNTGKEDVKYEMEKVTSPNNITNFLADDIMSSFRDITAQRSWAYYDMFFDRSILVERLFPAISMLSPINSFTIHKRQRYLNSLEIYMNMPGLDMIELTKQGLTVSLKMDGLKREDVKTFFYHDTFFIEGKKKWQQEHYITCIRLPEGFHKRYNMIKKEMEDGVFCATILCGTKVDLLQIKDKFKPESYIKDERVIPSWRK